MFRSNSRATMCELLLVIQELFRVRMILPIQLNLVYATRSFSGASMRQALHGDPLAVTELYGAYIKRNAGELPQINAPLARW